MIEPIPPRPWKMVASETVIRVVTVETDESVFWIDLEGVHRPSGLARGNFIVHTINRFAP